jgi:hypothetical protein
MKSPKTSLFLALLPLVMAASCGMDMSMPTPPTDLKVEEMSGGAHLTWKDNSDNESSFMIERMMGTSAYAEIATVPFDTTAYHDPNLAAGTYMYRVMAMPKDGAHGTSTKYSNEVTITLP